MRAPRERPASERWQQVEALYQAALECDGAERDRFLEERCGDDAALRDEVESLVRYGGAPPAFFDAPAVELAILGEQQSLIGARLGSYRITELLGAGGMGVVYQAHDDRLGRFVAIKILDDRFSARFEREARAVAALNHPNVCTLYDIGPNYLVMELVEGDSLATRLARGPLERHLVIRYGTQIADALAAAHAKGIVHRDLKPENVLIAGDQVKLVDFGLAVIRAAADAPADAALRSHVTQQATVLGTPAYMSPEHVRGENTDARTDLFSLGVVLHEATTGTRAFARASVAETMAAILKEEPPAIESDPELDRIIRRCLEKDAGQRVQTATEVGAALRALGTAPRQRSQAVVPAAMQSDAQLATMPIARQRAKIAIAVGVLALLAIILYAAARPRPEPWYDASRSPAISLEALQVSQLTTNGDSLRPVISRDGKYVAYMTSLPTSGVWVHQTATNSNIQIVLDEPGVELWAALSFSPDGSFVEFVRQRSGEPRQVWRVPLLGGQAKPFIDDVASALGWSPDGQHLAFVRADTTNDATSLVVADADGSHERVLATLRVPDGFPSLNGLLAFSISPDWSPDGGTIAVPAYDGQDSSIRLIDAVSGTVRTIRLPKTGGVRGLAWLDPRELLVNRPLDPGAPLQFWRVSYPDGAVISRLTNDLMNYRGVSLSADRDVLVTERMDWRFAIWTGDESAKSGGEIVPPTAHGGGYTSNVAWSADRVLYVAPGATGTSIMRVGPDRSTPEEVIPKARYPLSTSDGQTIVFSSIEPGMGIWKADASGRRLGQVVGGDAQPAAVTPDDREIVFITRSQVEVADGRSPWIVPIDGGTPQRIADVSVDGAHVSVSPDGKLLAFASGQRSSLAIIVCELHACVTRQTFTPTPGVWGYSALRWTPDGHGIAYVENQTGINIWVQPLDGSPSRQLTHFTDLERTIPDFAWSRVGNRLVISRDISPMDVVMFKGLRKALAR